MKKLIVEVRANEYMSRDENPNVPYTPAEIGRDAAEIEAAGASVIHFHARADDGAPAHDYGRYRDTVRAIRDHSGLLVHPTLGQITIEGDEARVAHIPRLAADGIAPDFASIDLGSTNIDIFDWEARAYTSRDKAYVNSTATLSYLLKTLREAGVRPLVACWSIPFVRTLEAFLQMGLIDEPAYVLLIHTGGGQLGGHPPTPAGLRAYLDVLPEREVEWSVSAKPGNIFAIAAQAIAAGGHVSIGIGDHPYRELGTPTNADLVRHVAELARASGREVATPAEARRMLGLP